MGIRKVQTRHTLTQVCYNLLYSMEKPAPYKCCFNEYSFAH